MVEKDKEYIFNIEALGYEGEGIAKIEGYPVFIPGALIGEKVKVIITKVKKNFAYGNLLEILEESDKRRIPDCRSYNVCGGCTAQHLSYEERVLIQIRRKDNRSMRSIARELGCSPQTISNEIKRGTVGLYHGSVKRYKAEVKRKLLN